MQQHGSKYFACRPPPPRPWVFGQNIISTEHGHVAYPIKWNHECSNMVANILPAGVGSKCQNSTFLEHGHVAYQIKLNCECSKMQAHILSLHTTLNLWDGIKGQSNFFSESSHVAYQIRREWSIDHHASTHSILTHTPSTPRVGSMSFILKVAMMHIKLKEREHRASYKHIFGPFTHPRPVGWMKR